jgi:hypothetical protein
MPRNALRLQRCGRRECTTFAAPTTQIAPAFLRHATCCAARHEMHRIHLDGHVSGSRIRVRSHSKLRQRNEWQGRGGFGRSKVGRRRLRRGPLGPRTEARAVVGYGLPRRRLSQRDGLCGRWRCGRRRRHWMRAHSGLVRGYSNLRMHGLRLRRPRSSGRRLRGRSRRYSRRDEARSILQYWNGLVALGQGGHRLRG